MMDTSFQGEAMLLGWAESHTKGRTVTFQLSEDGPEHPFRQATVARGKRAGQRYMMVLVEIADDETPVQRTPAQRAYALCLDPQFWEWCNERSLTTVDSEQAARSWILEYLSIPSRSTLNKGGPATARFQNEIVAKFESWREAVLF